jgi:(p)ppGpp synthase/HD superfamily hydrolase
MKDIIEKAEQFAVQAHGPQKRKYSGEPYIVHPIEVSQIVRTVPHTNAMVAAAILHDVIEDTEATYDDVVVNFGVVIADLVNELTDVSKPEDGNRAVRKALDRAHLAKASADAQTIKLADVISNSKDIKENDPSFAKVYIPEMKALLEVLDKGDSELMKQAEKQVFGK